MLNLSLEAKGKNVTFYCETPIPKANNLNTLKGTMGSL